MKTSFLALLFALPSLLQAQITLFVDVDAVGINNGSSWSNAYPDLQSALAVATSGDQIWVAEGTYHPDIIAGTDSDDRSSTFTLIEGVKLYGGFDGSETLVTERNPAAHPTILSGDLLQNDGPNFTNNSDNAYHVLFSNSAITPATVLDGFTITGGNASGTPPNNINGGGMFLSFSSPTLHNCSFLGNRSVGDGGGIHNYQSSPKLSNCSFQGNSAGNSGGGIHNYQSSPSLINCAFLANSAIFGGAIANNNLSAPSLTNCSFQGNRGSGNGGGIFNSSSTPSLTNCLLWNNSSAGSSTTASASVYNISSTSTYSHCIVANFSKATLDATGTSPDTNFNSTNPLFVSEVDPASAPTTTGGNLRLLSGSPALDVGNNSANSSSTDLAGNPRIQNTTIDLGAYETISTTGYNFATWIANYPEVGTENSFDDDPDKDGQPSGLENFFGTDPSVFSAGIVAVGMSEGVFTFTHPQGTSLASDLAVVYEWTTDLVSFYGDGVSNMAGTTTVTLSMLADTPATGTTTVNATVSGVIPERLFVRMGVTQELGM